MTRPRLFGALTMGLILCGCAGQPQDPSLQQHVRAADATSSTCFAPDALTLESIIRIESGEASASGVVIGQDLVLTVAHAWDGVQPIVAQIGGRAHPAQVLAVDRSGDLALLSTRTLGLHPLDIISDNLSQDEHVWAIGFPQLDERELTGLPNPWPRITTQGRFEMVAVDGTVFTSARVEAGASGGGLMRCEHGEFSLAGVVSGFVVNSQESRFFRNDHISAAVPANHIRSFVEATGFAL